jgi:uracil-DNA glycosylase
MISSRFWDDLDQEIITCRKCPRLVSWREQVAREKKKAFRQEEYWGRGVPGFGDKQARVLILGLAPGAHGSNRTGRMFTGDSSGKFLYPALYRAGFSNQEYSRHRDDCLQLSDLFISAVCRCAPPDNKPTTAEIYNCRVYLGQEIQFLDKLEGIVALGQIAFKETLRNFYPDRGSNGEFRFGHGNFFPNENGKPWLLASYHPSRQNTQTGRLTQDMFDEIWVKVAEELNRVKKVRSFGQ